MRNKIALTGKIIFGVTIWFLVWAYFISNANLFQWTRPEKGVFITMGFMISLIIRLASIGSSKSTAVDRDDQEPEPSDQLQTNALIRQLKVDRGITRLDLFANTAMQALLSNPSQIFETPDDLARLACDHAISLEGKINQCDNLSLLVKKTKDLEQKTESIKKAIDALPGNNRKTERCKVPNGINEH